MKEAPRSSETSVLTRATRRNNPEDTILHSHLRENLKSYTTACLFRRYINITNNILNIIRRPVFYFKHDTLETGFYRRLHVNPTHSGPIGRVILLSLLDIEFVLSDIVFWIRDKNKTNSVAPSPRANYTDWSSATCRRILVPTFMDRGVSRGQRGGSPTVVNLSFLDRNKRQR
jgi:hypothetical protein